MSNTIDALALKKAFIAGANNLDKNKEYINELNVFPVPDGDTGTNMTLTILSAVKEVEAAPDDMKSIAKAMSTGSLRGARGNSGVILSQLLRGFSKKVQDARTIDVHVIADAFQKAVETAYKAVMKPKEGTILTVAKGVASKARECADADMSLAQFCDEVIEYGDAVLDSTPEMLPVLKEAGVVDSGGQGLMVVLKGAVDCLMGRVTVELSKNTGTVNVARTSTGAGNDSLSTADIKFGYCTEFIINLEKPYGEAEEDDLKSFLESIGDSIVCVSLDDIVKIHVHTNHPGQAFEKGLTLGYLTNMKIDNMRIEHHERVIGQAERDEAEKQEEERQHRKQEHKEPRKKYGFITVSMGDGLKTLFEELGADHVIRTLFQILDDLPSFGILRHEVTLVDFQIFVHCRAESELEVSAAVNLHCFCPDLYEILPCCRFIVQNVDFCKLWMYHDWHKTAVAGAVMGQKIQCIGSAAEHTLSFSVSRVGFVWHFIGFLLAAEKGFDFLNALGIGGGNHL